jgi:maltose alpha-D-glucosyltransferase / alpha-amylase
MEGCPTAPADRAFEEALLDLFLIQKAAYEILYELSNRPSWVDIPLSGLLELIVDEESET